MNLSPFPRGFAKPSTCDRLVLAGALALGTLAVLAPDAGAAPKVVIISLDGATPRLVDQYIASGALPPGVGLRLLEARGVKANQNLTINPSLTAPAHIAIATGSSAASNDVVANSFRLQASPTQAGNISGFGAPIGGYSIDGPAQSPFVTAVPLWNTLRDAGKVVATATWPGGDGVNVTVPGTSVVVQPASERTVDYTVPFGAFTPLTGVPSSGAHGYNLNASAFSTAPAETSTQLASAGVAFIPGTPVMQKTTPLAAFTSGGQSYTIHLAVYDTTNDGAANYDAAVFFNQAQGIQAGPLPKPSTGSAFVKPSIANSALFYLEGHSGKAGLRFFVTQLAPDLSTVRVANSSANFIPRNAPVLADVDDINNNVGFWQAQPDFRIPERLSPGFGPFPDLELEAIYATLVREFVQYQTDVGLRAISRLPDADLVMIYIEQPDGSGHQFLLTDPRQPTDFLNPNSIGIGQDPAKRARYNSYLEQAYVVANNSVQQVINAVGVDGNGTPKSNVIVVSDHGFEPFHTAVNMAGLLSAAGIDTTKIKFVTSGPALNLYINLQGRQPATSTNTLVGRAEFLSLQQQIVKALRNFADSNPNYILGQGSVPIFDTVFARPAPADISDASFGRRVTDFVAQDSGDVFALLTPGYNFDGTQNPIVIRKGDTSGSILSVPNFYGAHGYDPLLPNMSAIFYAAGPNITPRPALPILANMDVAPTVMRILGVPPAISVEGRALRLGPVPNAYHRAFSRKTHGPSGALDIPLPLAAPFGVECRRDGVASSHTVVFQFSNPVTAATAAVTAGAGAVGSTVLSGNEVLVNLTGVTDQQTVTVTLSGISDGSTTIPSASASMVLLRGDVNGDRTVNATDIAEVRSFAYADGAITRTNVRGDLVSNGNINSGDAAFAKANLGHSVP